MNAAPPPRGPHTQPDFVVYQGEPEHLVADGGPEALVAGLDVAGEELVAGGGPEGDLDVAEHLVAPSSPPMVRAELGEELVAALDAARERDAIRTTKAPPVVVEPGGHPEAALDVGILDALAEHPELRALARPPVAALVAREGRPLPVVRRALAELAEHARDAAAVGERWSVATLARKARAYVRRAYADPSTRATSTSPPAPEPPAPPPRLASTVGNLRALRAALDTPSTATPRRLR